MVERLKDSLHRRLPTSASEQLLFLPPFEERERILDLLFGEIGELLSQNGIEINTDKSTSRVKTEERIQAKITRRGAVDPILDLYGIRLVVDNSIKQVTAQVIRENYPTPPEFPWGKPSFRDYSDEKVKQQFVDKFNPNISPFYTAIHIDILFGGGEIADIAEIQLMTEQELELAEKMWADYVAAQDQMVHQK